jgi:quercetin dioxygenase-like cupin family protein
VFQVRDDGSSRFHEGTGTSKAPSAPAELLHLNQRSATASGFRVDARFPLVDCRCWRDNTPTSLKAGNSARLFRGDWGQRSMNGARLIHADIPIVPSPSGLPSQHIVTEAIGASALFLGQQWLEPGDQVFRHSHPCEEAVMFLSGTGEATLDDEHVDIVPGCSVFFPAGVVHGFRNTGTTTMHVVIVFPVPHFAETDMADSVNENRQDEVASPVGIER